MEMEKQVGKYVVKLFKGEYYGIRYIIHVHELGANISDTTDVYNSKLRAIKVFKKLNSVSIIHKWCE